MALHDTGGPNPAEIPSAEMGLSFQIDLSAFTGQSHTFSSHMCLYPSPIVMAQWLGLKEVTICIICLTLFCHVSLTWCTELEEWLKGDDWWMENQTVREEGRERQWMDHIMLWGWNQISARLVSTNIYNDFNWVCTKLSNIRSKSTWSGIHLLLSLWNQNRGLNVTKMLLLWGQHIKCSIVYKNSVC